MVSSVNDTLHTCSFPIRMFLMLFCIFHGGAGVSTYSRREDRILFIKYRLGFLGCLSRSVKIDRVRHHFIQWDKRQTSKAWETIYLVFPILSLVQMTFL